MEEKIKDNPLYRKIEKDIHGVEIIRGIVYLLKPFSKIARSIYMSLEDFDKLKTEFKQITESPDIFNELFSDKGWIAHESFNHDLMTECISLAKDGKQDFAEERLADYYTSDKIEWLLMKFKATPAFNKRYELIRLAYEDTISKRYHSAIPILLMVIDGGVNDIDTGKGFFAESTDLTAWDSIAGHSTGLTKLRDIFNANRRKTNTNEIYFPYRNGILHGRDISYANKFVLAKCWLTLIAVNDWAEVLRKNKEREKQEQTKPKESLKEFFLRVKQCNERNQLIDSWQKRDMTLDKDIPSKGDLNDYVEGTPERAAVQFFKYWQNNNYGKIARQIYYFTKDIKYSKEAGRVSKIFKNKILREYKLISIEDCAPAVSEIMVKIKFQYQEEDIDTIIKLRMIYQNDEGESMVFGQKGGNWKFIDSCFFHQIEYPEWC